MHFHFMFGHWFLVEYDPTKRKFNGCSYNENDGNYSWGCFFYDKLFDQVSESCEITRDLDWKIQTISEVMQHQYKEDETRIVPIGIY